MHLHPIPSAAPLPWGLDPSSSPCSDLSRDDCSAVIYVIEFSAHYSTGTAGPWPFQRLQFQRLQRYRLR